ncbi:MAG: hypothetical protein KF723_14355 [Rhizobiaceae bacterium]|nr:hypothetical protein [Rhizobiaceae bacterium]
MPNIDLKIFAWIMIVAAASIAFSLALACATPFAAMAAIAGVFLAARPAIDLIAFAWVANQAVGFLVLGYPTTWDSFAWGAVIGVAALSALAVAVTMRRAVAAVLPAVVVAFLAGFAAYELVLFAAPALLPSGEEAFSAAIVLQIFWQNALALIGLTIFHWIAMSVGLLPVDAPTAGQA